MGLVLCHAVPKHSERHLSLYITCPDPSFVRMTKDFRITKGIRMTRGQ